MSIYSAEDVAVTRSNVGALRTAVSAVLHGSIWDGFNGPTGVTKDEALDYAAELAEFVKKLIRQYELQIDGSLHPAACGPGCRSQHTDDHSGCTQFDGDGASR